VVRVLPNSSGHVALSIDGTQWRKLLKLSTNTSVKADAKEAGDPRHVLLFSGQNSALVSLQYVAASQTYQFWSLVPAVAGDAQQRCGRPRSTSTPPAACGCVRRHTTVEARYSDSPYNTGARRLPTGHGINKDDIRRHRMPGGQIGVLVVPNQQTKRFGFPTLDGTSPTAWMARRSAGFAIGPEHRRRHGRRSSCTWRYRDGTLYAASRPGYDAAECAGGPLGAAAQRPPGDPLYTVDTSGTRGIGAR